MQNKEIFETLAQSLGGKNNINEINLANILFQNRNKIREIIRRGAPCGYPISDNKAQIEGQAQGIAPTNTSWYLFFADFREYLGIPRYMNLDTFNAFTEVIMTSGEDLNYDDFLKVFKKSRSLSVTGKKYNGPNVGKLINNQGEYIAQGLVELVANAIDATVTDKNIGRFGEGFYQSLKFLKGGDSKILVQTKSSGEKGFQISIKEENGENLIGSVGIDKKYNGTEVILEKKLSRLEQDNLKSFLIIRFQTNKKVKVLLNGEKINKLEEYIYYNGENLILPQEEVKIEVNENGFRVIDSGIGMSSKDLSEKLLSPNMSGKKRLNSDSMTDSQIEKHTSDETAFFYKHFKNDKKIRENNETKEKKTAIRLQVGGVLIEDFSAITSYDIEEFCLELPSFTWLPESRNKIELTKEVVISLKMAIEKISDKVHDEKEKLMLLEIIAKIIKQLKSRESSKASTKSKYDINKVSKEAFRKIKGDLEANGKIVLASIPQIQEILSNQDNIVFVDPELLNFEITKIPNIKKLVNIKNKQKEFYEIEFGENARYDYLILKDTVLVNSKYTQNSSDLAKINASVNLNTGYEQGDDIVFYGVIEDNGIFEEKKEIEEKIKSDGKENEEKEYYSLKDVEEYIEGLEKIVEDFQNHENIKIQRKIISIKEDIDDVIKSDYKITKNIICNTWTYEQWFSYLIDSFIFYPERISKNFSKKVYNFAKENSSNILDVFIKFSGKIHKLENAEKYLIQVMDLLEDETNAKYIIEYLKEFEDLSRNDIEELFAKFEGVEIEEEIEEKNDSLKDFTIIKKYLKENNLSFKELVFVGKNNEYLVETTEGKNILFVGNKVIDKIGGENFEYLLEVNIGLNGELVGVVQKNGFRKLFVGDEIIETIGGYKFDDIGDIHIGNNGEIRGSINIRGRRYLFIGDEIIETIGGKEYYYLDDIHTGEDGKLRGRIKIDGERKLFIGDEIIETIWSKDCKVLGDIHTGEDGNLRGKILIDKEWKLFIGDEIIEITCLKDCRGLGNVHTGKDGKFIGSVNIKGKSYLFIGDEIIETIGGYKCDDLRHVYTGLDGEIRGTFHIDGKWYTFIGDTVIEDFFAPENETLKNLTTIKNYLKENNLTFGSIKFLSKNNEYLIKTKQGKKLLFIDGFINDNIPVNKYDEFLLKIKEGTNFYIYDEFIYDNLVAKDYDELDHIHSISDGESYDEVVIGGIKYNILQGVYKGSNGEFEGMVFIEGRGGRKTFIGDTILEDFFSDEEYDYFEEISIKEAIKNNYTIDDLVKNRKPKKTYPQKISSFVEFLCKGGEFLQEEENRVEFETENNLLLTDIIGISRYFDEEIENLSFGNGLEIISKLKEEINKKLKNRLPFERNITSTIDGQDRASMIWLRESVQNSRDAIIKARKNGNLGEGLDDLDVNFYQNDNKWISRMSDNIGMTNYEVFKYLLTPGKSGKENDETATGMFGQGFYSLSIGAREVNLKTNSGNGKTTYLNLKPKYNENKDIIDFEIKYDIRNEEFMGTIIERVDDSEGIGGNIGALIGINNLQKYVGNVDDIEIKYNGKNALNSENIQILETVEIPEFGKLSLKQNKDKQERLTKDNLFLSEIKDEYLNFLPDFMIDYIRKNGYSLDLPSKIQLTKTRNAITDFEENIDVLRPHIFNLFTKLIIKDYLAGKTRLPMMPLDYYGLDIYEMKFDNKIVNLANRVNNSGILNLGEIEELKNKNLMIQYLINLKVENKGEIISIRELKKRRDDEVFLKKHTKDTYAINNNATNLNIGMEHGDREKIDLDKIEEKEKLEKKEFLEKIDRTFSPLVKRLFGTEVIFGFYLRKDKEEGRAVDYGFETSDKMYFNFNDNFWNKYKNEEEYKTIELMTHEFTHLVEDFVKGYGIDFDKILNEGKNFRQLTGNKINWQNTGFGSHQKDLEHEHSFEKIQRDILKMMTREGV
ncbi:MAG: hypothetical protein PHG82_02440 [Candidatus Gracilibacteria bacterium]|nr:hypothetical protein [Candidatus Gracilibacteria bacterium]